MNLKFSSSTWALFEPKTAILKLLSEAKGKFLMSSYPSDILNEYTQTNGWHTKKIEQAVSVANGTGSPGKKKFEIKYEHLCIRPINTYSNQYRSRYSRDRI